MGIVTQIIQFLLSISILVLLHEFGHFIIAKFFKTRVEKFYLFFNPWFSLFKMKKGETEYGIGWLPLGGYVKISGMIDESMDKEQLKKPLQPYEFRSKPTWQRLLIITAGVVVNIIFGIVIFMGILYIWGETYLPPEKAKYGIVCDSLALDIGLQNGDKILTLDNQKPESFSEITHKIIIKGCNSIQIERDGKMMDIFIPENFEENFIEKTSRSFTRKPFIEPRRKFSPLIVRKVEEDSPAAHAGLLQKDEIISINGNYFEFYDQFYTYLIQHKNRHIDVAIKRNNEIKSLKIQVNKNGFMGFVPHINEDFDYVTKSYSLFEAVPAGINYGYEILIDYIRSMRLIFTTKSGYRALGGFGTIGSIFPKLWNWKTFWHMTAFLSIMLAFLNILPIPALDGGHAFFIIAEMITGKQPGQKIMEYAQIAGFVLIIMLLLLANGNDIIRWVSS